MNSGGFGSFGSPSGFNTSTNLFSSQNRPGGLFGSSTGTTSAATPLGGSTNQTSGGIFSSANQISSGQNSTFGFASGTSSLGASTQTGTGHVKFQPTNGQDTISKNGVSTNISTNHQCITAMKEYEAKSLEELRLEDYQANRKAAQAQSQFGGSNLFSSSNATTGFSGSSGLFSGASTQSKPFGGFGAGTTSTTTSTPVSGGLFGQTNAANRSFFGGATTGTTATTTSSPFSGFGAQSTTQSGFGQTQPAQQTSLFGLGGTTGTGTTSGLFGSTQPTTTTQSSNLFGSSTTQTASKSIFGFGQTSNATQPSNQFSFSNTGTTTSTTTQPTTSIFGQTSLTQSPLSSNKPFGTALGGGGGFGATQTTGFGATQTATTTTSLFGQTQQKPAFGGLGGATTTGTTGGFGGFGTPGSTATTGTSGGIFGGFGSTSQPSAQTTATASPFGSTSGLGGATSFGGGTTGLFGSSQPTTGTSTTSTGGLFGSQPSSGFGSSTLGGGFGSQTTGQTGATTSQPSLFGGATGGLGSTTGGGIFGTSTNQQTTGFGSGLTGSTGLSGLGSTTGTTGFGGLGGFGSATTGTTTGLGSGLTGLGTGLGQQQTQQSFQLQQQQQQVQQQQQQSQPLVQQQLLALSNSPYGTASLLRNTLQDYSKKEDIFKPVSPIAQRPYITEATSPPKVSSLVSSQSVTSDFKGGLSQTIKLTPKPLSAVSLNKKTDLFEGLEDEETPVFYPRKNIKKLLFKPPSETNLSRRSSASSSVNGDTKPDFMRKSGFNEESIRYNENINTANQNASLTFNFKSSQITNDLTNVSDDGAANGDNQSEVSNQPSQPHPANIILERPGYFTIPSMQELATMTDTKGDCFVENFAIGRVDYGCIIFSGTTNLANMNLDEIIHIRRKEVHVYPDDTKKPPVGQGLNKPAEVTLHRIWPTDKATKMPVTEPNRIINMGYNKKIEKATIEMGAQFIDYDPVTGSWTFKVKHFSKYGLNDSDDEDDDDKVVTSKNIIKPKVDLIENSEAEKQQDLIKKQLKLIEMRRLELLQPRKGSIGSNLNSITNQQWDIINEYVPNGNKTEKNKYVDNSNLHLELSSDEDETDQDEEGANLDEDEYKKNSIRKALMLDNDNETSDNDTEDNKENNRLFPNLKDVKKTKKTKSQKIKPTEKIYPTLNLTDNFPIQKDSQQQNQIVNYDLDDKDNIRLNDEMTGENYLQDDRMDDLPFLANEKLMSNTRTNRKLVDAFFNEDRDEIYSNPDEEQPFAKFGGFNQKPITVGLLKRGLGGMSTLNQENKITIGETNVLSASLKGDQFHGQNKVLRQNLASLSIADVQQKIGSKVLKPKLWNRFVAQKPSKIVMNNKLVEEFDEKRSQLLSDEPSTSTATSNQLVPSTGDIPTLIELKDSITRNLSTYLADAGLFYSRRFRVNWSLNPSSFTYTQLASVPKNATFRNMVQLATPVMINLGPSNLNFDLNNTKLTKIKENIEKYLKIQLNLTDKITTSNSLNRYSTTNSVKRLPHLRTKIGNELIKKLSECTEEIRNSIGDNPDADNIEHMKSVWNLCVNLWGDVPENYKSSAFDSASNTYELEQIRKRLLGEWLVQVSSHRIDKECKSLKFNKNKDNYLNAIFSLLTGNKVLDACNIAIENSDFRLALLMSQSSGSNDTVRTMIRKQLNEWCNSSTDKFFNNDRLKLYVLISGELVYNLSGNSSLINVCENLDWKRQFGLHLWYHCLPIHSITDSLNSYETSISSEICNKPVPSYIEDTVDSSVKHNTSKFNTTLETNSTKRKYEELYDTCYHLIKLYCNNTHPIEDIVFPLNHTSNQLDFRLSWHLAMALVGLQYNHVSKSCLETLHDSYASQLQSAGLWHWSIFIIMHIEDEKRRESFVRIYLSKNVTSQSELTEKEKFLIDELNVPCEWIYEYKAMRAKYEHLFENQFQLLLKAHKWNEAHSVLIELIAPDLFIKENYKTLYEYLNTLSKESVFINKWNLGGQVYLDFIRINQKAQDLFNFADNSDKIIDEETFKEIQTQLFNLSSRIKDFDTKTPKKLLCSLNMSKLLLKFFNAFNELDSNSDQNVNEDEDDEITEKQEEFKILTKLVVEKATQLTNSVPDQDLFGTMQLKKVKYSQNFLMPKGRY